MNQLVLKSIKFMFDVSFKLYYNRLDKDKDGKLNKKELKQVKEDLIKIKKMFEKIIEKFK